MSASTVSEVVVLTWPDEEAKRIQLREAHMPRLLIVPPEVTPPRDTDFLEDWARTTADAIEIHSRLSALADRARITQMVPPTVDESGIIRFAEGWVSLGPIEAKLAQALSSHFGQLVARRDLIAAGWTGQAPRRALDLQVLRLRRHLAPLQLTIHNVRGHGYVLSASGHDSSLEVP
ncbi:MAG: helix-turn-helix protein [Acidimicrobiia bacterium]|nr:helix-turn-helix protein [Acidimicrobiia bacterium]